MKNNKNIHFKPIQNFKRGILFDLLVKSYDKLIKTYKFKDKEKFIDNLKKFDDEVFDNMETVGKCVFVTCLEDNVIGFASYDPRQLPYRGIIGHNVILPEAQGKGYGQDQIIEIIRLFKERGCKKILVTTSDNDFFKPAQNMYEKCGFLEEHRSIKREAEFPEIEYELSIL